MINIDWPGPHWTFWLLFWSPFWGPVVAILITVGCVWLHDKRSNRDV